MPTLGPALVTGGTGFLGRRLVDRLIAQGRRVLVLARRPATDLETIGVRCLIGDVADASAVTAACKEVETVFHTAARVGVWGLHSDFHRANVQGTRNILHACDAHGVRRLIHTSTPSVVYNGGDIEGGDESLPYTRDCPSPYPLTKALAEVEVLAANTPDGLRTIALRPHLIWGPGDPHLLPRLLARAKSGRLRVVGEGGNKVDFVHVENAADAHILAEEALRRPNGTAAGKAYFITNDEPVPLWPWIDRLLAAHDLPPVRRRISHAGARRIGAILEIAWSLLRLPGEPPMTRFVADELAKDHWFSIEAAKRDLGYSPKISMEEGLEGMTKSE